MVSPERIGVFGGTFDPPHVGHLVAAVNARHQLRLTEVLLVVAAVPWQKVGTRDFSSAIDRLSMVERAVAERGDLMASSLEIDRGGDSVTADTVEAIRESRPAADIVVIVGSDAAAGVDSWRRVDDLKRLASIAVVERPGFAGGRPPAGFRTEVVPCPLMDVSSSDLRTRVRLGLPLDYLVPEQVRRYIQERGLYP